MQIATSAAADVRDYYRLPGHGQREPDGLVLEAAGNAPDPVLVLSIDATGVNMIPRSLREATSPAVREPAAPSAQLATRERAGRCRMANVTALYDAAPAPRCSADIMPRDAAERQARRDGPRTRNRLMDASLQHPTRTMVTTLFDQAERRRFLAYSSSPSLPGPTPSGSAGAPRVCQGCSHPRRHHPGQAALSFAILLRQDNGVGLSPPHGTQRLAAQPQDLTVARRPWS
jgi:hypothetical protein